MSDAIAYLALAPPPFVVIKTSVFALITVRLGDGSLFAHFAGFGLLLERTSTLFSLRLGYFVLLRGFDSLVRSLSHFASLFSSSSCVCVLD